MLIVEDSEDDALILLAEVRRGGHAMEHLRVETREAMQSALQDRQWDIIISDYVLPRFSGLAALALMKDMDLDLPFIMVSGKMGEHVAVEAMKAGAHDYMVKGNLSRLVPAIHRELREAENRRQRRLADEALKRAYEELERKVAERTADLQDANVALREEIMLRKVVEVEREKYVAQLQQALADIKTLSGLLPICASCKKIRDDKGYWQQIEGYIQEHSSAEFTHGICPECARKLYPGIFDQKDES